MAEQDDAGVQKIRARLEAATPGPWKGEWDGQQYAVRTLNGDEIIEYTFAIPTWGERYEQAKATCDIGDAAFIAHSREDVPYLLARLDALTAENETAWQTLARERDSWQAEANRLTAERDELLIVSRECRESMSRATTAMARDVVTINDLKARLAAAESALTLVATMLRTRTIWGRTTGACPDPGCDSAACLIWRAINKAALTGSREQAQGEGA